MKMSKLFAAAILIFACSTTSFAQFMGGGSSKVGGGATADSFNAFWLSYMPTTLKMSGDGYSSSQSGYNTFAVGVTHAAPLSGSAIMAEYGVFAEYTTKTEKKSGYTSSMNWIGAKVPLSLMYGFALSDNVTLYPYAGVNARFYVIGKGTSKYDGESYSYNLFDEDEGEGMKRFALGYQLGVKANISGYFVGIGYEDMITSLISDHTVKFNYINLSVGIPF